MHRTSHATRAIGVNGTGKDGFTEGQKSTQTPPTVITADILNAWQEELCNVVTGAGLPLNPNDRTQLSQAIAIAATGSSSANAISIRGTSVSSFSPVDGDVLRHSGGVYAPGKVVNSNIATMAAIAVSKLAGTTDGYILGNSGGIPTWQNGAQVIRGVGVSATTPAADEVLRYSGGSYVPGKIANANIASNAAIAVSKLEVPQSAGKVLAVDGVGQAMYWADQATNVAINATSAENLVVPNIRHARAIHVSATSNCELGGIDHVGINAGQWDWKILLNMGAQLTLKHQSAFSTAANRFVTPGTVDYVIPSNSFAIIIANITGFWFVVKPA